MSLASTGEKLSPFNFLSMIFSDANSESVGFISSLDSLIETFKRNPPRLQRCSKQIPEPKSNFKPKQSWAYYPKDHKPFFVLPVSFLFDCSFN